MHPPADSPQIVTFSGSPPNDTIYDVHQLSGELSVSLRKKVTHVLLNPLQSEVLINYTMRHLCHEKEYSPQLVYSRRPAFSAPFARTSAPGRKPNTPSLYWMITVITP